MGTSPGQALLGALNVYRPHRRTGFTSRRKQDDRVKGQRSCPEHQVQGSQIGCKQGIGWGTRCEGSGQTGACMTGELEPSLGQRRQWHEGDLL